MAEVYLNYIEALNQYDPGNEDILFYLNEIRNRAGIPDYEECYPDRLSQEDLHEAIMRERMVEPTSRATAASTRAATAWPRRRMPESSTA